MPSLAGRKWTRDELFIAVNIYQKLAFGQFHSRNPAIVAVAGRLKRTPGSVAMKLSNLASLDPDLKRRGIKGLKGASNLDRDVWGEFHAHASESIATSEEKLSELFGAKPHEEIEVSKRYGITKLQRRNTPPENTEVMGSVLQRRGQTYFRNVVLNNYGEQCAVSRIQVRELLIASHILPWRAHPKERLNVQNGICLSRLHDAAFDNGLITFDDELRLRLSSRLIAVFAKQGLLEQGFGAFEGQRLHVPLNAFAPNPSFLAEHRRTVFKT